MSEKYSSKKCLLCDKYIRYNCLSELKKRIFCSKYCSGKYNVNIGKSGMKGRKHSNVSKNKMRIAHIGKHPKPFISNKLRNQKINMMKNLWKKGVFDMHSENMKKNNPMHNLETRKKVSFTMSKNTESYKQQIIDAYLSGKSADDISKDIKISTVTILKLLRRNNIKIRLNCFKQAQLECDDGHIAESNFERRIDNWLFHHQIPHIIHYKVFENRKIKADFKVGDVLIEGDGLGDCRPNKKKFAEKLKLYQDNDFKYIIINYDEDINLKLSFLLKYYSHINKKLEDFNAKQVSTLC